MVVEEQILEQLYLKKTYIKGYLRQMHMLKTITVNIIFVHMLTYNFTLGLSAN